LGGGNLYFQKSNKHFFFRGVVFFVAVAAAVSCRTPEQDPSEIFQGELPASLDQLVNPDPSVELHQWQKRFDQRGRVTVGVVDSGVDYLHPFLNERVVYDWNGSNQPDGVGYDFFAADRLPYPLYFDASLYAFGAQGVRDGIIIGAPEEPFSLMTEFNTEFVSHFLTQLSAHESLSKSLFSKLNREAISVFALARIALKMQQPEIVKSFREEYLKNKGADKLRKLGAENPKKGQRYRDEGIERAIHDLPWEMEPTLGTPDFGPDASKAVLIEIEGFLDFVELLTQVVQNHPRWNEFLAHLDNHVSYKVYRNPDAVFDLKTKRQESLVKLQTVWYEHTRRLPSVDTLTQLRKQLCFKLSGVEFERWMRLDDSEMSRSLVLEKISAIRGVSLELLNLQLNSPTASRGSLIMTNMNVVKYEKQAVQDDWLFKGRKSSEFSCSLAARPAPLREDYQHKLGVRSHPALFEPSQVSENQHGTHVAATVLAQNEKAMVLPSRVIVSTKETSQRLDGPTIQNFKENFLRWALEGESAQSVLDYISSRAEFQNSSRKPEAKDVIAWVDEFLDNFSENQMMSLQFVDQLVQAIKYNGQKKVKIVNMSLGHGYLREVDSTFAPELTEQRRKAIIYLQFEYFKNQLREAITEYAPKTLFVVAAGNDGSGIDGRTRSAIPCDLSSNLKLNSLLKLDSNARPTQKQETPKQHAESQESRSQLWNNTNVLCVGSISSKEALSSFTNIIMPEFVSGVHQVFALGESVVAPLRSIDCSGSDTRFEFIAGAALTAGDFVKDYALFEPVVSRAKEGKYPLNEKELENIHTFNQLLYKLAKQNYCAESQFIVGPMSGTSMAAPIVAGYVSQLVTSILEKRDMSSEGAYELEELSPANLIKAVYERSKGFAPYSSRSSTSFRRVPIYHPYRGPVSLHPDIGEFNP